MKTTTNFLATCSLSFSVLAVATLTACGGGSEDDPIAELTPRQALSQAKAQAVHAPTDSAPTMVAAATATVTTALTPWVPNIADTWHWQLTGTINTTHNAKVYDIDLFDAPTSVMSTLHTQGKYIVCYFSAGSSENWRPDFSKFKASDLGNSLSGWAGEKWVDTRSANVRSIMAARMDLAKARGCDGVEPDNVDGYTNNPGFPLTSSTQLDYNRFLANEARARGLKVALKNDVDQLAALQPSFDFAINEQCHQYNECAGYAAFTSVGKPVFNAEYKSKWVTSATDRAAMCSKARAANLRTLVLPLALNNKFRYSCD